MEQRVLTKLRKDFQVGSEDWNEVLFTKRRFHWEKDPQLRPSIEVTQEKAIEELEEIMVEKSTKEDLYYTCNAHKVQEPTATDTLFAK